MAINIPAATVDRRVAARRKTNIRTPFFIMSCCAADKSTAVLEIGDCAGRAVSLVVVYTRRIIETGLDVCLRVVAGMSSTRKWEGTNNQQHTSIGLKPLRQYSRWRVQYFILLVLSIRRIFGAAHYAPGRLYEYCCKHTVVGATFSRKSLKTP